MKEGVDYYMEITVVHDAESDTEEERPTKRWFVITPLCCPERYDELKRSVQLSGPGTVVRLSYRYNDVYESDAGQGTHIKPVWMIGDYEVSHCPFCEGRLPDIVPRTDLPERVCNVSDGGYYCDTCEERLMNCLCAPPEFHWKPVEDS